MTDFYAVYLLIIMAVVLIGLGLWFKRGWLLILSSIAWVISAIYCFMVATPATLYVYGFAVFCLAAGIATVIVSMTSNRKPAEQAPAEISHSDHIFNEVERVRKLRNRHKPQIKGYFEQ